MAVREQVQQSIGFTRCLDKNTIFDDYNGDIIEDPKTGIVSVYLPSVSNAPITLSKVCCEALDPNYFFDIENQKCRFAPLDNSCSLSDPFKLVLNPIGNAGTLFYVEPNDTCTLNIDLDYLFKIKCDTLATILKGGGRSVGIKGGVETISNPLQTQLEEQIAKCNEITIRINKLSDDLKNLSHSIYCENIPVLPTVTHVGPTKVKSFSKTAFGRTAPFGFDLQDSVVAGQNYCLTEPAGLDAWHNLLGDTNYTLFLQGNINSFTCKDVQTLFAQNTVIVNNNLFNNTQQPVYMVACDTPFGTKSNVIAQINELSQVQKKCQETIKSLQSEIPTIGLVPETQVQTAGCKTPLEMFETFDVSLTLDIVTSANTLQTIATMPLLPAIGVGNLYDYLTTNINSGFYVCGDSTDGCTPVSLNLAGVPQTNEATCNEVVNNIIEGLFDESGLSGTSDASDVFINSLPNSALASQWLHFTTGITDTTILSAIANQYIKLSLKINHSCGDFCVLIDEIVLDKVCTHVERNDIFLTQSPGFELERIRDNKKSWINNTTLVNRPFVISNNLGGNSIRQTNYDVNDERLVINTKEIDLDINIAAAIETDVWCYMVDNPCLLTGVTTCFPCIEDCGSKNFQDDECFSFMDGYFYDFMDGLTTGTTSLFNHANCCGDDMIDFTSLMTQPLSAVTTIEDFQYFLTSELIDAKNRQTISGYPTLRALYDRYMNSGLYCGNESSKFDYLTMDQFANLVGNYWVDIVEQVIPATTLWGSVRVYTNTIFDQQKYKYKAYTSLFCGNPFSGQTILSPINGTTGQCTSVSVATTPIQMVSGDNLRLKSPVTTYCDSLCLAQMNSGSEFIGTVSISGPAAPSCEDNGTSINEGLTLSVNIDDYINISLNIVGAQAPISYAWSNGDTGSTTTMTAGTYSVVVTDVNCNTGSLEFEVPPIPLVACWYSMQEKAEWILGGIFSDCLSFSSVTFMVPSMTVNGGTELIAGTGYSKTITENTINVVPAANNVESGCTMTPPVGYTYTDFVDLLNEVFVDLGLTNYTAQISLIEINPEPISPYHGLNSKAGFYIIRPENETFVLKTTSDIAVNNMVYTESALAIDWNGPFYNNYEGMTCEGITVVDGVVIE
jgi:hypothetical protein